MNEVGESESSLGTVGPYRVVEHPDGVRLRRLETVKGEYPDTSRFVFETVGNATEVADVLDRFSSSGSSKGWSRIRIGERLKAVVRGGQSPSCKFYRFNPETLEIAKKPFRVAKSKTELIDVLVPFSERKNEC